MKKYAPPRTVTKRGRPSTRRGSDAVALDRETACDRAAGHRLAVADERVALGAEPGELRAGHPRVLQELELAADVGVQRDEVQATRGFAGRSRVERARRREPWPVRATAPHHAVEAHGRDQVAEERLRAEAEVGEEPPHAGRAAGVVGVARVGASHVRAKRAAQSGGVLVVRELVEPDVLGVGVHSGHRLRPQRGERLAGAPAAHERGAERLGLREVAARLLHQELPEAAHVLLHLTHHEVGAVAAEVLLLGRVLGRGQDAVAAEASSTGRSVYFSYSLR